MIPLRYHYTRITFVPLVSKFEMAYSRIEYTRNHSIFCLEMKINYSKQLKMTPRNHFKLVLFNSFNISENLMIPLRYHDTRIIFVPLVSKFEMAYSRIEYTRNHSIFCLEMKINYSKQLKMTPRNHFKLVLFNSFNISENLMIPLRYHDTRIIFVPLVSKFEMAYSQI